MKSSVHVWDLPLRLFHWLLVLAVSGAFVTGKLGGNLTEWHARFGGLVLGLLVFRLIWGFIGSTHARFVEFFPTVSKLRAYIKGHWQGVGHNPIGALAVIALLAVLSFLVATGVFANDDIAFEGPLFDLVDKELSDKLSGWHILSVNLLLALLVLHIGAMVFYQRVKKTNLITPMFTGKKYLPKTLAPAASAQPVGALRFIVTLLVAVSVVWTVWSGSLNPLPASQANSQTPQSLQKT